MNKTDRSKVVPELRFPEFEEELKLIGFAELGEIKIGLTHTPKYIVAGIPFLSSKNISNGYIDFENIQYISEEEFLKMPASTKPKIGDILFTRVGSNLGNPIILEENRKFGIFVSLGIFRVNKKASNLYLKYWMDSDCFWEQIEQKVAGGAKNNLNTTWLKEFKLYIPSIPEQQKIADSLASIDKLIIAQNQKLEALKAHKKGLLQNLFPTDGETVPSLRFKEFEGDGDWEEKKLGEIGQFIGGGTPDTLIPEYWNGDILWYTPTEVKNGSIKSSIRKITEQGLKNSSAKILSKGTILITTRATIGDVAIAENECSTNQGFQSLIVNDSEVNLFWFYWIIQHKEELIKRASGSTFKEIGKNEITNIPTLSPKKPEQQKIADCLFSIDELITSQIQKIESLKAHKKGLMQQLFPNVKTGYDLPQQ